jgi:hypothetical protein
VLFCVLAAVCMAVIVIATSRLVLMGRPVRASGYRGTYPAPPPGEWTPRSSGRVGAAEQQHDAADPANEP